MGKGSDAAIALTNTASYVRLRSTTEFRLVHSRDIRAV